MNAADAPEEKLVWVKETDHGPWSPRDSMGHLVYDGKMWVMGGFTPGRVNDVWCSSDGRSWQLVTEQAAWEPRNLPGTATHRGKMWIMGGYSGNRGSDRGRVYNDVWCSSDGDNWDLATPNAPWSPRSAAPVVTFDNRMWVTGGSTADFVHSNEVWCSETGEDWDLVTPNAPWRKRGMHASVVFDEKIWVLGGGIYNEAYPLNTVEDYNDVWCSSDGEHWDQVTPAADWRQRRFHRSAVYDDRLWVLAGFSRENLNDVWWSDDGIRWHQMNEHAEWSIRHEPGCLVFKDRIWVLGGYDRGPDLYNDVWSAAARS